MFLFLMKKIGRLSIIFCFNRAFLIFLYNRTEYLIQFLFILEKVKKNIVNKRK